MTPESRPMSRQIETTAALEDYVWAHNRESAVARALRAETAQLPQAGMQIGPDQAALLALLLQSIDARRVLEIGTFTGYSALAMASVLPVDGKLICCDISEEWTAIARRYWNQAGVADHIELRLAPALDTLMALRGERVDDFDLAFIDADKGNYDAYYEACLQLIRTGGLIVLDNMLWSGSVADPAANDADTTALRALNSKLQVDPRIDMVLLTLADGVTLVRKR